MRCCCCWPFCMAAPLSAGFFCFGWIIDRRRQPRIRQVELVHDLVVIVAGSRGLVAGEQSRIGPFEENVPAVLLVELRMLLGIVKTVLVVGDDLARMNPRTERRLGLRKPHFAER